MEQNPLDNVVVILEESDSPRRVRQLHLVLAAASIDSTIHQVENKWILATSQLVADSARYEIDAYCVEQAEEAGRAFPIEEANQPAWIGVFLYLLILGYVMYAQQSPAWGSVVRQSGEMQSSSFQAGEWWRCFTALTLHHDAAHLAGNLAMGGLYGWMASRRLGAGRAWLGIVSAGALGNALSGMIRPEGHISIGASTAVFAALGILSANATHGRYREKEPCSKRWLPLVAGGVLFAWTGTGGPETDVLSHVTGFCAGIILGVGLSVRVIPLLSRIKHGQAVSATLALTLVIGSWLIALS